MRLKMNPSPEITQDFRLTRSTTTQTHAYMAGCAQETKRRGIGLDRAVGDIMARLKTMTTQFIDGAPNGVRICRCTLSTLEETARSNGITKTALITVGDFLTSDFARSHLYDPSFSTEFREAKK